MLRISSACWRETSWLIAIDATIVAPRLTATITDRRNHPTLRLIATPSARTRGAAGLRVDACRECMLDRNVLLRHDSFRRLCLARDLLREVREPSPSIAAVARDVGISPFHFIRQFEALFGQTPHQYRIQPGCLGLMACLPEPVAQSHRSTSRGST